MSTAKWPARFVVDASIGVAWVHRAQTDEPTERSLDAIADGAVVVVPALWFLEVANALLVLARRKRISDEHRRTGLEVLLNLGIQTDSDSAGRAFGPISEIAARTGLSIYDAVYLDLAVRLRIPLLSRDRAVATGARKLRVVALA